MWVTGPHVCPFYLNNDEDNKANKREDESGRIWHFMGDKIRIEGNDWIYSGRSNTEYELFDLEQKVYNFLSHSEAFIHKTKKGG